MRDILRKQIFQAMTEPWICW